MRRRLWVGVLLERPELRQLRWVVLHVLRGGRWVVLGVQERFVDPVLERGELCWGVSERDVCEQQQRVHGVQPELCDVRGQCVDVRDVPEWPVPGAEQRDVCWDVSCGPVAQRHLLHVVSDGHVRDVLHGVLVRDRRVMQQRLHWHGAVHVWLWLWAVAARRRLQLLPSGLLLERVSVQPVCWIL